MEGFEAWKQEVVKKWLEPHNWDELPLDYQWADSRTEEFWKIIQNTEKDEDYEWLVRHGVVGGWQHTNKNGILRGFRGEDWVRAMVGDFGVSPYQPPVKSGVPYDLYIPGLGTVDVKTTKFGDDYIKIKTTFYRRPSIYVVGLKTCDEAMTTFQFVGWLYGHEIYKLLLNRNMPYESCMTPSFEELHTPESFFNELIDISKKNSRRR